MVGERDIRVRSITQPRESEEPGPPRANHETVETEHCSSESSGDSGSYQVSIQGQYKQTKLF